MSLSAKQTFILVDDHEVVLGGTLAALQQRYPEAEILTASHRQQALELVRNSQPDLLLTDLSIPESPGKRSQTEIGLKFLREVMESTPELNIVVQSAYTEALVRLRPVIHSHLGGFAVVHKNLPLEDLLDDLKQALKGRHISLPGVIDSELEVKPEWLDLLELASQEVLRDRVIAERMNVSLRTVHNYWERIREVLGVYPEGETNIREHTLRAAREAGLID